ncbi:phosphoribosylglycinamide formyltransferase [candidate division WOR-3 bacterium]|nr:phosphoribosylglycinamide formyltransferase [candidate division WOR-3 bacterium]
MEFPIGVLVSGRGSNLEAILLHIKEGKLNVEVVAVISDNEDARALKIAEEYGVDGYYIPCIEKKTALVGEAERKYIELFQKKGVKLVVLAGFMRILKKDFLTAFKGRIINIHPALLPSFKGLNAQKQAFEYGVKISGCTVHFIDEGVDTGPIILQEPVPVFDDDSVDTLSRRILKHEHEIYSRAIQLFSEGRLKIEDRRVRIIAGSTEEERS